MGTESDSLRLDRDSPPLDRDLPPLDRRLAALAARQHGVVGRDQLRRLGIGPHGIAQRIRTGRLHRKYRGVYALGHRVLGAEGRWLAAVLACGPGAALSHASAAALWELRVSVAAAVDVTVPTQAGRRGPRGVRLHRSTTLAAQDVVRHRGIPVTTVARTLFDLADLLLDLALERTVHEAEYRGLLDLPAIESVVERCPRRRGRRVLALAAEPPAMTHPGLEERFLELCRRHGLPRPEVAAKVEGFEVDFLWRRERLVVETDGRAAHRTRRAFERDRVRDRRLLLAGYRTVRLTARALREEEKRVVADLRSLLDRVRTA